VPCATLYVISATPEPERFAQGTARPCGPAPTGASSCTYAIATNGGRGDSTVKRIDAGRFAQRFSPRNPKSGLTAIKANKDAWRHFRRFSPSYKRIRIAFIEGARDRPRMFERRLRHFIEKTAKNQTFGFGGIQKYY
jgi:hypothetical protein